MALNSQKQLYSNAGNSFVVKLIPRGVSNILDIGCGCGDTATLIKQERRNVWIEGITFNPAEGKIARGVVDRIHIIDIEEPRFSECFEANQFDCLLFSHVLEHLREPSRVIEAFLPFLKPEGFLIAAVPNILEWRTRSRFLLGKWNYEDFGVLDRTHLRFYTFNSVLDELFRGPIHDAFDSFKIIGDGAAPLFGLRRIRAFGGVARQIDRLAVSLFPNLFAQQVGIVAVKSSPAR